MDALCWLYTLRSIPSRNWGRLFSYSSTETAPHWPVSGGLPLQGAGGQHGSFQSTNVLNWINKECSFGNAQPYIGSGLWYNPWGRAILQQVQAALTPATNESSDNYKRIQAPLLGSLIEGQPHTFKNNRRSLMTLYGLINGPFMRKN